jgi:hypothetical protein
MSRRTNVIASQPHGYRIPSTVSLTAVSRTVIRVGATIRRDLAVCAVATVAAALLERPDDQDAVLRSMSHDQIGIPDLTISNLSPSSILGRAAEFIDLGHALMHRPSAIPMPAHLDLRFSLNFFDDRDDPDRSWTYILLSTASQELENAWNQVHGVERYRVVVIENPLTPTETEYHEALARKVTWDRVLAPYQRAAPLSWTASEPELLFDVIESTRNPEYDDQREADGRITARLVLREAGRLAKDRYTGDEDVTDLLTREQKV